jgi:hypothetical protein
MFYNRNEKENLSQVSLKKKKSVGGNVNEPQLATSRFQMKEG